MAVARKGSEVQAILLAGDRGHSRAVDGRSKAFVEVGGRPMVAQVLDTLVRAPEVSEVYVVGDAAKLHEALRRDGVLGLAAEHSCPVHVVPQHATLYENVWRTFLLALPPGDHDPDHDVLVVPVDIPLAIPEEISEFVANARAADVDYALGLTSDVAMARFAPSDEQPGIEMAYFNLREGRCRQNNLHLVRPLKMGHRHYIQDMYESRYQKELWNLIKLVSRIAVHELRNLWVVFPYLVMHVAGLLDRRGYRRAADLVRRFVSLRTVERGIGALLQTRFVCVFTHLGGAALDVDNDQDRAVADKMIGAWREMQTQRVRSSSLPPGE